ncbi:hypothetical protein SADUNF_Sadunf09G0036600 [Salix dunnii]|uniref:Clp R domain-containing protein n=1 Tax=Salix dunnii TaxID=1413687 RepID=A0A835JQB0_9ROSI|nr:hypothetical protein SADUNF_Sadunf09G0036600 [Salix dunnii]
MPTPVGVARQCLTEEAARALDEAVAVARRRSHSQTTSLHAVSALLALPDSTLKSACSRATTRAYSARRQFHVLDLCVGVSLDRLPSSKTLEEDPPISNSLMAAIKRSQANQRRHPDNFHMHQIHCNQQTASVLRVEMKHFILSILDDPIVSRVFGEAGFRSSDIKMAIVQPPVIQTSRFSRAGCAPVFLCNLPGSNGTVSGRPPGFSFPFSMRREGKGGNLLLVGVCASNALKGFVESVIKDSKGDVLPGEISGVSVISVEDDVIHFVSEGGGDTEKMGMRFEELGQELERCSGPGIVVNIGDLKVLVGDNVCKDAVSYLVSKLTGLLEGFREKMWLVGAADSYDTYLKSVGRFLGVEKDWDLRILPITSYKSPIGGFGSKSSLLGSFVPFGGFFSTPSDFKIPPNSINQSITRCNLCNAKYVQDVAATLKMGPTISVAEHCSDNLPSSQMAEFDMRKAVDMVKTKDDGTSLNDKILALQNRWNDICQRLHHAQPFSKFAVSQASITEVSEVENVNHQTKLLKEVPRFQQEEKESPWFTPYPMANVSLPTDRTSTFSVTSVTTDLGLGTLYASSTREPNTAKFCDPREHHELFSSPGSAGYDDSTSVQIAQSSSCSGPSSGGQFNVRDFKSVMRALSEQVGWQDRATHAISKAVSRCKAGHGRHHGSNSKGDISFTFLGPDRIGKKKIASALAVVMFGSIQSLISVDLGSHGKLNPSNLMLESQELHDDELGRSTTIVDYIASKLSKKPHSLIFLENVDKADPLVQNSLSHALRTGRFPDSRGREVSTNNTIFVATSEITVGNTKLLSEKETVRFSEEMILGAQSWQMQIIAEHVAEAATKSSQMNVRISREVTSSVSSANKRKLDVTSDCIEQESSCESSKRAHKVLRSYLDLNLPVEDTGEECANYGDYESDSISERTQAWLEDFSDQVDEKVVFEPFDFDSLAEKTVKEISKQCQRVFGSEVLLEIDHEVLVQILAASWLSEKKRAMEEWIEEVVGRGFSEARQKSQFGDHCNNIKLVTCRGLVVREQAPGICLPSRINL